MLPLYSILEAFTPISERPFCRMSRIFRPVEFFSVARTLFLSDTFRASAPLREASRFHSRIDPYDFLLADVARVKAAVCPEPCGRSYWLVSPVCPLYTGRSASVWQRRRVKYKCPVERPRYFVHANLCRQQRRNRDIRDYVTTRNLAATLADCLFCRFISRAVLLSYDLNCQHCRYI